MSDDGVLIGWREKGTIVLQDWDPTWSTTFDAERQRISFALGEVDAAHWALVSEVRAGGARPVKVIGVADANDDGRGEVFVVGAGASQRTCPPPLPCGVRAGAAGVLR